MRRTLSRPVPTDNPAPNVRVYLRRSLGEEKQAESIDSQRAVCERFRLPPGFDWANRIEYTDSDRSGDNFAGRADLQRLLREAKAGDVILTRDGSRIGRDALECAIVIRDLVQGAGARLFYSSSGEEAKAATAIDSGMNVLRGMGAQMELEGIRSRTRDALRLRASQGFAVSVPSYGYSHVRVNDKGEAVKDQWDKTAGKVKRVIDPTKAEIVRRIFREYLAGNGRSTIVKRLNADGIPSARGVMWGPETIPPMLVNPIYRGMVVHGVTKTVHVGGESEQVHSDDRIIVSMPELAIVDLETWDAVQAALHSRKRTDGRGNRHAAKHPLVGIAKCDKCGASIMAASGPRYVCTGHNRKGPVACKVTVRQRAEAVEGPLRDYLLAHVVGAVEEAIKRAVASYCIQASEAERPDLDAIEAEVSILKKQQKRLVALAVETDDPIPEIADKLKLNKDRIAALENRKREAERAPTGDTLAADLEGACLERLRFVRGLLTSDRDGLREAFRALFPGGLRFVDGGDGTWEIVGAASVGGSGNGEPFTTAQKGDGSSFLTLACSPFSYRKRKSQPFPVFLRQMDIASLRKEFRATVKPFRVRVLPLPLGEGRGEGAAKWVAQPRLLNNPPSPLPSPRGRGDSGCARRSGQ